MCCFVVETYFPEFIFTSVSTFLFLNHNTDFVKKVMAYTCWDYYQIVFTRKMQMHLTFVMTIIKLIIYL